MMGITRLVGTIRVRGIAGGAKWPLLMGKIRPSKAVGFALS